MAILPMNENSSSPILRVVSSDGTEIKEVDRPEIDIEYVGSDPNVRVNLIIRAPKIMAQYKSTLIELGARYNALQKVWRMPAYICLAVAAEESFVPPWTRNRDDYKIEDHIGLSEGYLEWRRIAQYEFDEVRVPQNVRGIWDGFDRNGSNVQLYPYQKEAVRWLVENPYGHPGSVLCLSPGLGKTLVALTAAAILDLKRVLIIAPLSLLSIWQWEKANWFGRGTPNKLPARVRTVYGASPPDDGWVITNYNTVASPKRIADFCEHQWDLVIIDESVMIKNRKSQRFMNIKNLRQSTDRVWMLSGSPITKHPSDLWAQFNIIDARGFPSFWRFTRRWCSVEDTQWGTKITGSSGRNLRDDFKDILFVKNQEEVLPDLPEMMFEHINCPIQYESRQYAAYKSMSEKFVAELEESGEEISSTNKLSQMVRLQQITSNLLNLSASGLTGRWSDVSVKANALADMIENEAIEYPLLIWTHWRPGAHALEARIQAVAGDDVKVATIQGDMSEEDRADIFRRFKGSNNSYADADIDILILSLGVGKYGLSMQKTRTVVYMDKSFMADDYIQSLYRVRRIGLTHSPRVITLHCPSTVDEVVEENLAGKSVDISHITNSNLAKLLRSLNRRLSAAEDVA